MLLQEAREFTGQFWLPEHLDRAALEGKLGIDVDGKATLRLSVPPSYLFSEVLKDGDYRDFLGIPAPYEGPFRIDEWIVGLLSNHRYVALNRCHDRTGYWLRLPTGRTPVMTMAVERCVLLTERDIRESPESTMAQSATARIDGLREWFSRGRIDVDELPYDSKSPTVAFRLPQDTTTIELSIDGHACTLELSHAWTNWHLADDKADLEQDATAVFKSEDPQSIDWWQTIVAQLSNFLTFLARAPCRVQEMKTEFPNASSGSRQDGMAMEVFYPDPIPLGTPRHRQTLFSAHRIGVDRLQAVLQGWFDLCAGHSPTRSVPIQYILASSATGVLDSQCAYLVAALGKMAGQTAKKEPAVQSYNEINALVEGSCLPTETKEWCASLASRGIFFESKKEQFERLLQECGLLPLLGGE